MTLKEYNERLKNAVSDVETSIGETMVMLGLDALATIKDRVIKQGKDSKGGAFPKYSTKPMLVGCKTFKVKSCERFFGSRNNKKHRWATLKRTYKEGPKEGKKIRLPYLEGGYRELREMELGAGHGDKVDFSYKNDMWNDIHIISGANEHGNGMVIIGALRQEEKDKLFYNTARNLKKGGLEILDLSEEEVNELANRFKLDTLRIMRNNGL